MSIDTRFYTRYFSRCKFAGAYGTRGNAELSGAVLFTATA